MKSIQPSRGCKSYRRIADVEINKGGANYCRPSRKHDFFSALLQGWADISPEVGIALLLKKGGSQ